MAALECGASWHYDIHVTLPRSAAVLARPAQQPGPHGSEALYTWRAIALLNT